MKFPTLLILVVLAMVAFAGCKPADDPGTNDSTPPKAEGAPAVNPKAADPSSESNDKKAAEGETAALAKCDNCGMEVPKAELTLHDGKMLCKHCMESHVHE